mmetsp:Transcript_23319/g.22944  ORF Transcript_23319/g.22944 Transcript_23319/m.22944 type:complete len:154 (+) Transcript_23319:1097-1558(+)
MSDFEIPLFHEQIVETFISKFTLKIRNIVSNKVVQNRQMSVKNEWSMNDQVDIRILLKSIPNKIQQGADLNVELFNFGIIQESIIAFQNMNIVNAFEYFDDQNRERIESVKENLQEQKTDLVGIKGIIDLLQAKIERNNEYQKDKNAEELMKK